MRAARRNVPVLMPLALSVMAGAVQAQMVAGPGGLMAGPGALGSGSSLGAVSLPGASGLPSAGVGLAPAATGANGAQPGWRVGAGLTGALISSQNPRYTQGLDLGGDTVLQVSPSLELSGSDGVFSGQAQYLPSLYAFARTPESNDVRHTLRSIWRADLLRDRLSVDAAVLHGQQTLSAFASPALTSAAGAAATEGGAALSGLFNNNVSSVTTAQVAPTLTTRVAGLFDASLRYQRSHIDVGNAPNGRQDADVWRLSLGGGALLPWSVAAVHQQQRFETGRSLQSQGLYGLVSHAFVPEFTVRLGAGAERRNFESSIGNSDSGRNTRYLQAGFSWTPNPRTAVGLDLFDRYFGAGWQALANHRTGRMAWRLAGGRTVVDGVYSLGALASQIGAGSSVAAGDLYNQLLSAQEPDAAKRQALVSQALQARGLEAQSPITGISGSLGPNLQNRLEVGWFYTLPRQTISLVALRTQAERILKDPLNPTEDLARFGAVTQSALQMSVSHRLTPDASLVLSATQLRTQASRVALPTALDQLALSFNTRLGLQSTLGLSLRQGRYHNPNLTAATGAGDTGAAGVLTSVAAQRQDTSVALLFSTRF